MPAAIGRDRRFFVYLEALLEIYKYINIRSLKLPFMIHCTCLLLLRPKTRIRFSGAIAILGPLTKTKKGHRFLFVISNGCSKLTDVVALRRIDAYTVAVAFVEARGFKYGPPRTLISDNGKQFAAKFFQAVCSLLGLMNIFTSTYNPRTNGQVERYNRTIPAML